MSNRINTQSKSNGRSKICIHLDGTLRNAEQRKKLGKELASRGFEVAFICDSKIAHDFIRADFPESYDLTKYDEDKVSEKSEVELFEFIGNLGIDNIRDLYFTENIFLKHAIIDSETYLKSLTLRRLKAAKDIIENGFHADYFFDFAGDEIFHNIFKIIALARGGRRVAYRETVFPDRTGFMSNKFDVWSIPKYDPENIRPSEGEMDTVNFFVSEYFAKEKVFWGDPKSREFKVEFVNKVGKFKLSDFFSLKKYYTLSNVLKRSFTKRYSNLHYKKLDDILGKKYYYFPLHYPMDSQLVFRGRPFLNQVSFIELLASYVPQDQWLVVKEHPHARGALGLSSLKRLSRIRNVILVHPWQNSHAIIKNARAVLVINSTVAVEALYHEVPVVSFGKNYLKGHGLVNEIEQFYDFDKVFDQKKYIKCTLDDFKNFLFQGLRYSYPVSAMSFLKNECSDEEVKTFATALIDFIRNHLEVTAC